MDGHVIYSFNKVHYLASLSVEMEVWIETFSPLHAPCYTVGWISVGWLTRVKAGDAGGDRTCMASSKA
jgi:hypothetical protein